MGLENGVCLHRGYRNMKIIVKRFIILCSHDMCSQMYSKNYVCPCHLPRAHVFDIEI